MSNAGVSSWKTLIKDLQQLLDAADPASRAAANKAIYARLNDSAVSQQLPHAAWKKLVKDVQVTRKLVALCVQAREQHATLADQEKVWFALQQWLALCMKIRDASPESRLSAIVAQQLQDSGLLQHLAVSMSEVADELSMTTARRSADHGNSNSGGGGNISSSSSGSTVSSTARTADKALRHAQILLQAYGAACTLLTPEGGIRLNVAGPPAAVATRLILTVFQACSLLQLPAGHTVAVVALDIANRITHLMAEVINNSEGVTGTVQRLPAAQELLLSPDLAPSLAVGIAVTLFGLDTKTDAKPGAGSSSGNVAAGSSSSLESSKSGPQDSGVNLANITPLSARLFDLLGVDKGTIERAAGVAKLDVGRTSVECLDMQLSVYFGVLSYQVKQAQGKPLSQQMLLQLEVHMLLTLLVLQLTAALPAKHRDDLTKRLRLSMLHDIQMTFSGLHSVPLAAAYTGPQLALQVWPTPAGVGVRQQKQQQEQEPPQTESIQPPVTCVLVPTAALLAEMLPLLTKHCLTALKGLQHEQQQHQYQYQQQQQQQHQQQQGSASQQAGGGSAPASTSGTAAVELSDYSNPSKPTYMGHTRMSLFACVDSLAILLSDLVVPEQTGAAPTTEVPMAEASVPTLAAAAAASSDSAPAVPEASYSYVLHAQETIMPHVVDTLRVLEGLLRETAAGSVSLAGLLPKVAAGLSALCSYYIKEDGPNNRSSTLVTLALAAGPGSRAQRQLYSLLCTLLQIIPALPHKSKHVAQQLCEIASGAAEALLDGAAWQQQQQQRHAGDSATAAAASDPHPAAAVAMLPSLFIVGRSILYIAGGLQGAIPGLTQQQHPGSSAQEQPQPGSSAQEQPQPGSSARQQPQPGSSAQEQPQPGSSAQEQQKPGSGSSAQEQQQPAAGSSAKAQNTTWSITLGPLLKWLQAGSTSEQLAAAGYTLQSVLQHLGQMPESSEAVFTNKNSRQPNEAALLAAVQQYRATGLALCSFAVSCVCNNPGCFNLSGPSALHLVSGRSCLCGGCRTARFCSHACLRACWKHHKPVCEALAAAAAATAAAASSAAAP